MSNKVDNVLRFESVSYTASSDHDSSLNDVSFELAGEEAVLVRIDGDSEHAPILDLALGLLSPASGSVRYMDKSWDDMDAFEAAANRGRIGCVFEMPGWVSSLSVAQNVMLRERHHSKRGEAELCREAEELAKLAGLAAMCDERPDVVRRHELRVWEWVRACMGDPALLVLVSPEKDAASHALPHLIDLVERAISRGSSVLWLTASDTVWNHGRLSDMRRCAIEHERWKSLGEME